MALTTTSLAVACGASDTTLSITSTSSGFPTVGTYPPVGQIMQIDSEKMLIQTVPVAGTVKVMQRGYDGSTAVAHGILASVQTSSAPADFPAITPGQIIARPPSDWEQVTLGADGAITVPTENTNVVIVKGSACLFTLAAPSTAANGLRLTITSQTAWAHVLTATTLLENGLTGSPFTTATFGAFIGATLNLVANNGVWNVVGVMTCVLT